MNWSFSFVCCSTTRHRDRERLHVCRVWKTQCANTETDPKDNRVIKKWWERAAPALHSSSSEDQFQHLLIFCGVMASLVMKKHNYYLETLLFIGCQDNKDRGRVQTICCFSCFLPLQKGKVFKDSASPMALAWERYTCGRPRNTHRLGGIYWISCGVSEVDRGSGKPWTNKNMNHKGWNQSGKWNYPIPQRQERVSQGSHRHLYSCTSQVIAITS